MDRSRPGDPTGAPAGKGGLVLYLLFTTPGADFDELRPVRDRMLPSLTLR
jgi:hypothetical protein